MSGSLVSPAWKITYWYDLNHVLKVNLLKIISLLARTIGWNVKDIAAASIVKKQAYAFEWSSLPLDESVDVTNTTQLFIREVSALFEVTEVLALTSLHGTTKDENIFKGFEKLIILQYNLKWNLQWCSKCVEQKKT